MKSLNTIDSPVPEIRKWLIKREKENVMGAIAETLSHLGIIVHYDHKEWYATQNGKKIIGGDFEA
jgi:hypothetical protein